MKGWKKGLVSFWHLSCFFSDVKAGWLTLLLVLWSLTGCEKPKTSDYLDQSSYVKEEVPSHYKSVQGEPILARVQGETNSHLMSLSLAYAGEEGFEKSLEEQKDPIQNLVISILADYKRKDLQTHKGKAAFEKKLLTSLNGFVSQNKFKKVTLIELKEI